MDNAHGLIAVTENISTAGAIVWWRLKGGLDLSALSRCWLARRLDTKLLPSEPGMATALRRAIGEQRSADMLVRPLPKGGFAVVKEESDGNDLSYTTVMKAWLDELSRLHVESRSHAKSEQLMTDFVRYQSELVQADVSPWLSKMMEQVSAVALRDTGGVYFIPAFALKHWEEIVSAIREASAHAVFAVPALRSEEAVTAIEDAISMEAEAAAATIEAQVNGEAVLGERALQNRIDQTNAVEQKLMRYEELLGRRAEILHERLDKLRAMVTVALVKAQHAADAAE